MSDSFDQLNNAVNTFNNSVALLHQGELNEAQIALAQDYYTLAEKEYYSSLDNMAFQQDMALKNFGLQSEAYDWNKKQRKLTLEREDNAIQRQVQDLKKAGLSPLMVNQGSASSNAQVLNAPQYDGSAVNTAQSQVNQAVANRKSATELKADAYQRKLEQSNFNKRLQLENLQLTASMLETVDSVLNSSSRRRLEKAQLDRQLIENNWYDTHGFQKQDLGTVLSDFLNKVGKDGTTPGTALANAVQENLDKVPEFLSMSVTSPEYYDKRIRKVSNLLKEAQKGSLSPLAIEQVEIAMRKDGFNSGLKGGRWKSLSNQEAKDLLDRYIRFMEEKKKAQK